MLRREACPLGKGGSEVAAASAGRDPLFQAGLGGHTVEAHQFQSVTCSAQLQPAQPWASSAHRESRAAASHKACCSVAGCTTQ